MILNFELKFLNFEFFCGFCILKIETFYMTVYKFNTSLSKCISIKFRKILKIVSKNFFNHLKLKNLRNFVICAIYILTKILYLYNLLFKIDLKI